MTSICLQSLAAGALALVAMAGCDQVFGVDSTGTEPCGDGVLLAREACDDGALEPGDGCGPTCEIEPGFECRAPGEPCLPVVGLARDPSSRRLEVAGETTGNPFAFTCPPGEVLIGFEGHANQPGDNLGALGAVCGSLGLTLDGTAQLTRSSESGLIGAPNGALLSALCAPDEIASGLVPTTNTYVSGFRWICQPVTHTGGVLQIGAPRVLTFGPSVGTELAERRCAPREVVSSMFGTAGSSIDSMGIGCSAISTVLCGDGEVEAPEACDDGNLTPGDGCGRRCQLE